MHKAQQKREKWVEVVEEYERSGLTQREFAAQRAVALSTLQCWLRRSRAQRTQETMRLLPVQIASAGLPVSASDTRLEVVLPSGVRLAITPGTDVQYVARLVQVLGSC
jgi:hypothetical protein